MGQKKKSKGSTPSTPSRPAASSSAVKPGLVKATPPPLGRPLRPQDDELVKPAACDRSFAALDPTSSSGQGSLSSSAFPARHLTRPATVKNSTSVAGAKPPPSSALLDSLDRNISSALSAILSALSTVIRLCRIIILRPGLVLLGWAWAPLLVLGIALGAALLGWRSLQNGVASLTSSTLSDRPA